MITTLYVNTIPANVKTRIKTNVKTHIKLITNTIINHAAFSCFMPRVIIAKGLVPQSRTHQADEFYSFLESCVRKNKLAPEFASCTQLIGADCLIGHSRGTNTILDAISSEYSPRRIILFDPSDGYQALWNSLTMPKTAFISECLGRPWAEGFDNSIYLKDTHYFPKSRTRIARELDAILTAPF